MLLLLSPTAQSAFLARLVYACRLGASFGSAALQGVASFLISMHHCCLMQVNGDAVAAVLCHKIMHIAHTKVRTQMLYHTVYACQQRRVLVVHGINTTAQ